MSNERTLLFNPNPENQYPIGNAIRPTITGAIYEINTAIGRQIGANVDTSNPWIVDTNTRLPQEGVDLKLINKRIALESEQGQRLMKDMPNGTVSILLRQLKDSTIPLYAVKIAFENGSAHFAVAGNVANRENTAPARNLSEAKRLNVPPHLSPTSNDPTNYSNAALILGDAYHRAVSLLGEAPTSTTGHNALDGQHNPGLHKLLVAALSAESSGNTVKNPGTLLHGLHQLHVPESQDTFNALRESFHKLSTDRPVAPISLVTFGNDSKELKSIEIAFPGNMIAPDGSFLNVAMIAPMSSVISEFVTTNTAPPKNPDTALSSLDAASGGLDTIL